MFHFTNAHTREDDEKKIGKIESNIQLIALFRMSRHYNTHILNSISIFNIYAIQNWITLYKDLFHCVEKAFLHYGGDNGMPKMICNKFIAVNMRSDKPSPSSFLDIDEAFETLDPSKRINISTYTRIKQLGKGRFVEVIEVRSPTGESFAMKKLSSLCHLNDVFGVISEIKALTEISHSNILKCFGYDYKEKKYEDHSSFNFYIIMELADAALSLSLKGKLGNDGCIVLDDDSLSLDIIKQFIHELISAFVYLHKNKIAHRDIKPENILIFKDHLKVNIGFGNIIQTHYRHSPILSGTINYMSPEVIDLVLNNNNSEENRIDYFKSDVFSLGLLFLRLATSENTEGINNQMYFPNLQLKINELIENVIKKYNSISFGNLLKQMLVINPQHRIDFDHLWQFATSKDQFLENEEYSSRKSSSNKEKDDKQTEAIIDNWSNLENFNTQWQVMISNIKNFKSLKVDNKQGANPLVDDIAKQIINTFKLFNKMEKIAIHFSSKLIDKDDNKINDEIFYKIIHNFVYLNRLQAIDMDFEYNPITDDKMKALASSLIFLINLNCLRINMEGQFILFSPAAHEKRKIIMLAYENTNLYLNIINRIQGRVIHQVQLKNLCIAQSLEQNHCYSNDIQCQRECNNIKTKKNSFSLIYLNYTDRIFFCMKRTNITEEGIKELIIPLTKLKSIKSLYLNFSKLKKKPSNFVKKMFDQLSLHLKYNQYELML